MQLFIFTIPHSTVHSYLTPVIRVTRLQLHVTFPFASNGNWRNVKHLLGNPNQIVQCGNYQLMRDGLYCSHLSSLGNQYQVWPCVPNSLAPY